jgi:hypothetical protein
MKEKQGIYSHYTLLEDIDGGDGRIYSSLSRLNLNITKKVTVSYFATNSKENNKYESERISFKEFQHRMLNDKDFNENVFMVYVEGVDYGIDLSGGELWVFSENIMTADFIYNQLIS